MPKTYSRSTYFNDYKDDWSASKGFHKVLFNSGRALQARELNQLQTIIQEEIARLGNHLFKNGAVVNPGGVVVNNGYEYVRLKSDAVLTNSHVGAIVSSGPSETGIKAKIVQYVPGAAGDVTNVPTIFVQYLSTSSGTAGDVPVRFSASTQSVASTLYCDAGNLEVAIAPTDVFPDVIPAVGTGTKCAVEKGSIFVLGHFVHVQRQSLILSKYFNNYTGNIGFKIVQDIVTTEDTVDLYDNQGATPNLTSPGADRYRIRLKLTKQELAAPDEDFVFLAKIVNGEIVQAGTGTNQYNKINDLLAQRTREESGNYIVEPFKINFSEIDSSGNDKLYLNISKGVAYINGYRAVNPAPKQLVVPKPNSIEEVNGEQIPVIFDRYFIVDTSSISTHRGLPDPGSVVNLYNATGAGGSVIGTVVVRSIERGFGNTSRIYIGKTITKTSDFRNARSIGLSGTDYYNIVLEGNPLRAVIKGQQKDKDIIFRLPRPRPKTVSDVLYTFQYHISGLVADGSGNLPAIAPQTNATHTDANNWLVASADSGQVAFDIQDQLATNWVVTGLAPGNTYEVITYQVLSEPNPSGISLIRTKTSTNGQTSTSTTGSDDVILDHHDVWEILDIKDSSMGNSIKSYFSLDDGQRDTHYEYSRLIKKYPYTGSVYADYNYFARGTSGHFYAANSYVNVPYDDIPQYTPKFDATTRLFNTLDFRPDLDAAGNRVNNTDIFYLPKRASNISADVEYYLPRADKLMMTEEGNFVYLKGVPDKSPQYKKTPDGALDLYKILMNANTLNPKDVKTTQIEARRYTMADIGKIERKVDRLEEVTTLSLLELDTKNLNVLDADGNVRTKSGFFVDNFADQTFSATSMPDYRASVDMSGKVVRPLFTQDNIRLLYNSSTSAGVIKKGDNVYLEYQEVPWKSVNIASQAEPVNPFMISFFEGDMVISPASDEWKDTKYKANKVIDGGTKIEPVQGFLWNEHEWNWGGSDPNSLEVGDVTRSTSEVVGSEKNSITTTNVVDDDTATVTSDTTVTTTTTTTAHTVSRIVSSETVQEVVGDRVVQLALIPWMRSRKIFFKAEGLRPNTRMFPFFNGVNVSNWCRSEATFIRWADRTDDKGNQGTSKNTTGHPEGSTDLVADEYGCLIGSFYIPNTRPKTALSGENTEKNWSNSHSNNSASSAQPGLRFPCGDLEFKLLDIERNQEKNAIVKAAAVYSAKGTLETRQKSVLSTRILKEATMTTYSESTIIATDTNTNIEAKIKESPPTQTETLSSGNDVSSVVTGDFKDQNDIIIDEPYDEPVEIAAFPAIASSSFAINEIPVQTENAPTVEIYSTEGGVGNIVADTVVEIPNCVGGSVYGDYHISTNYSGSKGEVTINGIDGFGSGASTENTDFIIDQLNLPNGVTDWETAATLVMGPAAPAGGSVLTGTYATQTFNISVDGTGTFDPLQAGGSINASVYPTKKSAAAGRFGGRGGNFDPIAQTFYVDNQYGIYLTKVAIFFSSKDDNIPVRVEIRPEVNGVPSSNISMISKTLTPAEVQIPTDLRDITSIRNAPTFFEFDEPVFLSPFSGYAICVIAPNTTAYNVYAAEMEKYIIGSTTNRILKQPDLGSFFRSQNSRTWEPAQKIDMMYSIYRASFKRGGYVIVENADVPDELLEENPINTTENSREIYVEHHDHGLIPGDKVRITGLDSATLYGGILGSSILHSPSGYRTVTKVDANGYTFNADDSASVTAIFGGDDILSMRNMQYNIANVYAETIIPNFTSVSTSGKFTTGKPLGGDASTSGAYLKDTDWTRITPRVNTAFSYPRVITNRINEDTGILAGKRSATFKFDLKSASDFVSPVLDLQRCSLIMIENMIDNQDSANAVNINGLKNTPIRFTSEENPYGGSNPAKHITSPITLAEDAVGLKVFLAANKPPGASFELWYRTAVEGENILDKNWSLDIEENSMPADENPSIFREYSYLIGGDDGTLESFTEFQLKIVFKSTNSSKVPVIRDLRAIAMVD